MATGTCNNPTGVNISPRIAPIAIFDPVSYIDSGCSGNNCVAQVVNLLGFFVEGMCSDVYPDEATRPTLVRHELGSEENCRRPAHAVPRSVLRSGREPWKRQLPGNHHAGPLALRHWLVRRDPLAAVLTILGARDSRLEELVRASGRISTVTWLSDLSTLLDPKAGQPDVLLVDVRQDGKLPGNLPAFKQQHPSTNVMLLAIRCRPGVDARGHARRGHRVHRRATESA